MLSNLLLANITISLPFFFLFRVVFNSFFTIPVKLEITRLKLALAIRIGAPITVANDAIEMLPVVTDKTINNLSIVKRSNAFTETFASLISATK